MTENIRHVRANCFRLEGRRGWGIVEYTGGAAPTGKDWLARVATYQTRSRYGGKVKRPTQERRPRYRRVGFYSSREKAIWALRQKIGRI